jgi:hypothetical protein
MLAPEIIVSIIGATATVLAAGARGIASLRARKGRRKRSAAMLALEMEMRARGSGGHARTDVAACIAADACACVIEAVRCRRAPLAEDALARIRTHALGEIEGPILSVISQRVEEYARALEAVGPRSAVHTLPLLERLVRLEVLARVGERGVRYAGLTLFSAEHNRRAGELAGFVDVMRRLGVAVGVCVVEHRAGGAFVVYADERAPLELGATLRASFDSEEDENAIAEGIVAQWTSNERAAEIAEFRLKRGRTVLVMLRGEPREFMAATVDSATTELALLIHAVYENEHTMIVRCDEAARVTGVVCSGPRAARAARGATGDGLSAALDSDAGTWRGEPCTSCTYKWGVVTFVVVTLAQHP